MNFLYDDIVHVQQNNGLLHKFRHRSTRRMYWNVCLPNSVK